MVAGDSQARLLVLALLRLLLDPVAAAAAEPELFRRHRVYHAVVPARGISVDFIWAPFESNLTRLLHEDLRLAPRIPDVLVLGSGLWHMLHVTDASQYSDAWTSVADAANSLRSPLPVPPPHLFGHGLPRLVNPMFNADAKKAHMDDAKYFPRTRIPKPRTRKVDLRLGPARSPSRPRVPRCLRHRALRMPSWTRGKIPGRQDRHMENPKNPKTDPAERQDLQSDPRTPRPRCDKYFCPDATRSTSRNTAHFAAECQVLHFERHDRLRRPEDHECDKIGTDPEESDAPRRHAKFVYPDAKIYIPDPKTLNPGVRSRSRRTLNPEADPEPRNPKIVEP